MASTTSKNITDAAATAQTTLLGRGIHLPRLSLAPQRERVEHLPRSPARLARRARLRGLLSGAKAPEKTPPRDYLLGKINSGPPSGIPALESASFRPLQPDHYLQRSPGRLASRTRLQGLLSGAKAPDNPAPRKYLNREGDSGPPSGIQVPERTTSKRSKPDEYLQRSPVRLARRAHLQGLLSVAKAPEQPAPRKYYNREGDSETRPNIKVPWKTSFRYSKPADDLQRAPGTLVRRTNHQELLSNKAAPTQISPRKYLFTKGDSGLPSSIPVPKRTSSKHTRQNATAPARRFDTELTSTKFARRVHTEPCPIEPARRFNTELTSTKLARRDHSEPFPIASARRLNTEPNLTKLARRDHTEPCPTETARRFNTELTSTKLARRLNTEPFSTNPARRLNSELHSTKFARRLNTELPLIKSARVHSEPQRIAPAGWPASTILISRAASRPVQQHRSHLTGQHNSQSGKALRIRQICDKYAPRSVTSNSELATLNATSSSGEPTFLDILHSMYDWSIDCYRPRRATSGFQLGGCIPTPTSTSTILDMLRLVYAFSIAFITLFMMLLLNLRSVVSYANDTIGKLVSDQVQNLLETRSYSEDSAVATKRRKVASSKDEDEEDLQQPQKLEPNGSSLPPKTGPLQSILKNHANRGRRRALSVEFSLDNLPKAAIVDEDENTVVDEDDNIAALFIDPDFLDYIDTPKTSPKEQLPPDRDATLRVSHFADEDTKDAASLQSSVLLDSKDNVKTSPEERSAADQNAAKSVTNSSTVADSPSTKATLQPVMPPHSPKAYIPDASKRSGLSERESIAFRAWRTKYQQLREEYHSKQKETVKILEEGTKGTSQDATDELFNIPGLESMHISDAMSVRIEELKREMSEAEARELAKEEKRIRTLKKQLGPRPVVDDLSEEWIEKVSQTIDADNSKVLAKSTQGVPLRAHDFRSLVASKAWLNDEIVNASLASLEQAINQAAGVTNYNKQVRKCLSMNSFFWDKLKKDSGLSTERLLRRMHVDPDNLLKIDTVLIPICENSHWTLIALKPVKRQVLYFDSFNNSPRKAFDVTFRWLRALYSRDFDMMGWEKIQIRSPMQTNGSDCGVHAITNAMCCALDLEPESSYVSEAMCLQRLRIGAVLLNGGFHGEFDLWKQPLE